MSRESGGACVILVRVWQSELMLAVGWLVSQRVLAFDADKRLYTSGATTPRRGELDKFCNKFSERDGFEIVYVFL